MVYGSVGPRRWFDDGKTHLIGETFGPVVHYSNDDRVPYTHLEHLGYGRNAPFCKIYIVTDVDTEEMMAGIDYTYTNIRNFYRPY